MGTGQLCWSPRKRVRLNTCRQLVRKKAPRIATGQLSDPNARQRPPSPAVSLPRETTDPSPLTPAKELAKSKETTQIALPWVLAQNENAVSIPGASKRKHLEENLSGARFKLNKDKLTSLNELPAPVGGRY